MISYLSKYRPFGLPVNAFFLCLAMLFSGVTIASSTHNQSLVSKNMSQVEGLGHGRMTYWGFTLYDAKLYASKELKGGIALDIQYLRKFEAKALVKQTLDELKNLGVSDTQRAEWADPLAKAFKPVQVGDSITAIKKPEGSTQFFYNGQFVSEISGESFSQAFFGIWLHPKTSAPQLRKVLLGQYCPRVNLEAYCHD
jgi:exopolysaccharide biosynthesis protein